jgi:hypothetical protein
MNDGSLTAQLNRWQLRTLILGIVTTIICATGAIFDRAQFFQSYLWVWLFWSGLSFGALVIVMMQFLTGGKWGLAVRELSIAAFRTLPFMALLFLPIVLGVHQIYGWSNGARGEAAGYHHKAQYLNVPFFAARSAFYFTVLVTISILLRRWSRAPRDSNVVSPRVRALSAGGLIVYVLCMNFASTDWVMSLNPEWYSTIFVEVFAVGQFLAALALTTALLALLARDPSLGDAIPTRAFHDLGNMLLAFVIFWTYVAFAQFLIIWSGNLPKEISWYLVRSRGGWQWFALALGLFAFFLPFALLLSRAAKRNRQRLAAISLCILGANILINYWLVAPTFHAPGIYVHWLDVVEWCALGGFWFALFFYFLKRHSLLPRELIEMKENG